MNDFPTFVSHLECSETGKSYPADTLHNLSETGKPLLVRYDLDALAHAIHKDTFAGRKGGFWRYAEFLPVRRPENVVRLGEVIIPILKAPRNSERLGCGEILIKDKGCLPTGSFKARGLALESRFGRGTTITVAFPPMRLVA